MERDLASATIEAGGTAMTAAGRATPGAAVAGCPGWTVADAVRHLGQVHRWAAGMLREYPQELLPFEGADDVAAADLPEWADTQRAGLLDALAASDGDRPVWAFGRIQPARFWWRRQAIETALHAWDTTDAAGTAWPIPPAVAAEGIDELFEWILPRSLHRRPPTWGTGRTIHLHRTDGDGEWLLTIDDPPVVSHGHAKGDLAVRGPAADLLRWTMNRPAAVELFGDTALAEAWSANVAF